MRAARSVQFLRLQADDFKVYKAFTFDFASFAPGCHSIRGVNRVNPRLGSNGVGKSTLWDALCFALYGKTAKRLRAQDVQPYGTQACPVVSLDLVVDAKPYQIVRHAVPHALSLDGASCTQERVDALLGMDLDLFLQTVVLAQGLPLFLDLEPRHKLSLLSDVLHLDRFEDYAKQAQADVAALAGQERALTLKRESLTGAIAEVGREMAVVRRESEAFTLAKRDEIKRLVAEFNATEDALVEARSLVDRATAMFDAAYAQYLQARDSLRAAEIARSAAVSIRKRFNATMLDAECPTCLQVVTEAARTNMLKTTDRLLHESNYSNVLAAYNELDKQTHEARAVHAIAEAAHRDATRANDAAELALAAARRRDNPHDEPMRALKARITDLHRDERKITKQLVTIEEGAARLRPWVNGFRDIRLMVLDDTLRALGLLATSYANELGLPCTVAFGIDRQTKSGSMVTGIHMTVDAIEKFEAWSGGEAQRLRLAASLALSATLLTEAGLNVGLIALDEPSAHLSPEGLSELTAFLTMHAEAEGRTVFLTDQRPLRLDSTVMLERTVHGVFLHR